MHRIIGRYCRALGLAFLVALVASAKDARATGLDHIVSADAFEISGDVGLAGTTGIRSWTKGGFGKFRASGGDSAWKTAPYLGRMTLAWKPQFGFAWSATVVGVIEGGSHTSAGLSEAYLTYRPIRTRGFAFSARAGLMWPPVSLEHEGSDWHVRDSITPSAINSWIGEEVKPVAAEATVASDLGAHRLKGVAAVFAANDTAGTLLTGRCTIEQQLPSAAFRCRRWRPISPLTSRPTRTPCWTFIRGLRTDRDII